MFNKKCDRDQSSALGLEQVFGFFAILFLGIMGSFIICWFEAIRGYILGLKKMPNFGRCSRQRAASFGSILTTVHNKKLTLLQRKMLVKELES